MHSNRACLAAPSSIDQIGSAGEARPPYRPPNTPLQPGYSRSLRLFSDLFRQ